MIANILAKAVKSKEFFLDAKELLRSVELEKTEYNVVGLLEKFFDKYSRTPSREELLLFLPELAEPEQKHLSEYKDLVNTIYGAVGLEDVASDVLLTELKEKARKQKIKSEIVKIADTFDNKTAAEISEVLQDLVFSGQTTPGTGRIEIDVADIHRNIDLARYRDTERIPTNIAGLDRMTYGGPGKRELWTIIAPSGRGKSAFFVNLMYGFMLQGYSVLYVTLEMGVVDILRRLYRRVLYQDKDFLRGGNEKIMEEWLTKFFNMSQTAGRLVYFPANTLSTGGLKTELMRLDLREGFVPDVILIDHLDLMMSTTKSVRQKEGFSYWRLVVDELREIPLMQGISVMTATQSNRESAKKVLVGVTDVGESYGKVQSSDVVLSLNQTPDEVAGKRLRVNVLKNRDYISGMEVELFCDLNLMTICDINFAYLNRWL